jgi:hypothetical protein
MNTQRGTKSSPLVRPATAAIRAAAAPVKAGRAAAGGGSCAAVAVCAPWPDQAWLDTGGKSR